MEVTAPALTVAFLAPHVLLQRVLRHRRTYPDSKPIEKNTAICFYGFWLRHEVVLTESPEKFVGIPDTDVGTLTPICCSDGNDLSCSRQINSASALQITLGTHGLAYSYLKR